MCACACVRVSSHLYVPTSGLPCRRRNMSGMATARSTTLLSSSLQLLRSSEVRAVQRARCATSSAVCILLPDRLHADGWEAQFYRPDTFINGLAVVG